MQNKDRAGAVLDALFELTDCEYFSDLKDKNLCRIVFRALGQLNPSAFSLHQWSYALTYITNEEIVFQNTGELERFLVSIQDKQQGCFSAKPVSCVPMRKT